MKLELLDRLRPASGIAAGQPGRVSTTVIQLAKLGGYLARTSDLRPGNTVIWRGMTRLADIEFGFQLGGNRPTNAVIDGAVVQMSTTGRSNPKPTLQV